MNLILITGAIYSDEENLFEMLNFNIISNNSADYGGKKKWRNLFLYFFKGLFLVIIKFLSIYSKAKHQNIFNIENENTFFQNLAN